MYSLHGFRNWGIGDVDVLFVDGVFHLFHLVLPNHDYIAHAVSGDGLVWDRVKNAMFVGDPGAWDDDMLWTMHVTPDPHRPGGWRMFYTGLSRHENGRVQRVGLARSRDLYTWTKETEGFPLEIPPGEYESDFTLDREWVSFRDPYLFSEDSRRYLLASARVSRGPIIRRGCVALAREERPDRFVFDSPLHWPRLYDDIEVPGLLRLGGRYYLIGSIREDVKVHYWTADSLRGPYGNAHDNVLLPQGNYAARICPYGESTLVWNFFYTRRSLEGNDNLLPPPKELVVDDEGLLQLRSFRGFDDRVVDTRDLEAMTPLTVLGEDAADPIADAACWLDSESGFRAFLFRGTYRDFRLRCRLTMEGRGKCGFLIRVTPEGDGYYLSLDLLKGLAQIRAWGAAEGGTVENTFSYRQLQSAHFPSRGHGPYAMEIVAFGRYLEFSVDGFVVLTLADSGYAEGAAGVYAESSRIRLGEVSLETLRDGSRGDFALIS